MKVKKQIEMPVKKLTVKSKKYIALLLISEVSIAFFIQIVNLRLFDIIGGILGIIVMIILLYLIIVGKEDDDL